MSDNNNNEKLHGKVAIVTGASSGMGKAAAIMFAKEGVKGIVLVSRTQSKLEDVAKEIRALGSETKIEIVVGDIAKEMSNKAMVEKATTMFGQLDIAFINAGVGKSMKLVDVTEDHIEEVYGANLKSVIYALKYCLPAMKESPSKDTSIIVNSSCMGSVARNNLAGMSIYSSSKAAVDMLVKYAAIEASQNGQNTRVNAIAPGVVATNIMGMSEEQSDGFGKNVHLIDRAGRSEEIANLVTFLASQQSSFITGSIQTIDGGWSLKA